MNKNELRKSALMQRLQYDSSQCNSMSAQITEHFFKNNFFNLSEISYLHLFLPIENKNEVDTFPIFHQLLEKYPSVKIVLSKCNFDDYTMSHFIFEQGTILQKNKYGIPEPISGTSIHASQMDMVIVPLLVVDHHGNRIGYGKGFYDRFLAECSPDCKKIGLSFEKPIDRIPSEDFDIPIDFCVTPYGVVNF